MVVFDKQRLTARAVLSRWLAGRDIPSLFLWLFVTLTRLPASVCYGHMLLNGVKLGGRVARALEGGDLAVGVSSAG